MAVKCSCGYVNHNPDARSCELCHAKLTSGGAATAKVADHGDDLARAAAAAGVAEEETPKKASAGKPGGAKQEAAAPRAPGTGARGAASGLDALLFVLAFPVTFPAALFVLLRSHDWGGVPVTVWIGQALLALTAAFGVAISTGPGSPAWLAAVLPLTMASSLAGALLLVRMGEKGAGWASTGALVMASCVGSGMVLASRVGPLFEGHKEPVRALDVSRDGKHLATVAEDGALRVFEVESRLLVRTTAAHVPVATSVRYDKSGERAITAGSDGLVSIWELDAPDAAPMRIEAHRGGVTDVDVAVAEGATDPRILTSGVDGTLRLWAPDGSALASFTQHKGAVTTAAFSPDGTRVASGGTDGVVYVWTPGRGSIALEKHKGPVVCVAWAPAGDRIISGGEDRTIWLWDLSEKKEPPRLLAADAGVRAIAVLPGGKGKRMVSAHDSRTLVLWDLDKGVSLGESELPAIASALATSPDGAQLFVATGRLVRILDVSATFPAP